MGADTVEMKVGGFLLASMLLCGCVGKASQACDDLCSVPDECFAALGVPDPGDRGCVAQCLAGAKSVGVSCINAIVDTIHCLPSCDVASLTPEEQLACQDEAELISTQCN